ncbi:hypothetical protein [Actinopolyspora saharensis]|nr:hypothetical protein [Actinopolyspora saharensis]
MQKIRRYRQITIADLAELEQVLIEAGLATPAHLDIVYERGGLGVSCGH